MQSGGRKRVGLACIPCYRKKQKVRKSSLSKHKLENVQRTNTLDLAKYGVWLTQLRRMRSVIVVIRATSAQNVVSPRSAHIILPRCRTRLPRRRIFPTTMYAPDRRKSLTAALRSSLRRRGGTGKRTPPSAARVILLLSCSHMWSIASQTLWL